MVGKDYFDMRYMGTSNWYRHTIARNLLYTDSVKDFAEKYGAYWVVNLVASYMPQLSLIDFTLLTFDVEDSKCNFTAREDIGRPPLIKQEIAYTDMEVSIQLYLEKSEEPYFVLMFPSDH